MVDDPLLPPRLRQARRSHSHCVEERSRLVLERVHLVDACRVHAGRSEVECRNTVPLRAEHGDHLVPAPCSMAKAMDRDEMLATATAAAFHFLSESSLGLEHMTAWSAPAISSTSTPGLNISSIIGTQDQTKQ
uniref:Uncharacterized protein n=1 Tax=Oryza glumipatula TaxID=40148 RepID=A0A0D9YJP9_9ORYZ